MLYNKQIKMQNQTIKEKNDIIPIQPYTKDYLSPVTISQKEQNYMLKVLGHKINQKINSYKTQKQMNNFEFIVSIEKDYEKLNIFRQVKRMKLYQDINISELQLNLTKILRHSIFQNLLEVNLNQCSLTNCQFISYLEGPVIKKLLIPNNNLYSLKPLQKLCVPTINVVKICSNPVKECNLHRSRLNGLQSLILEFYRNDKIVLEDLRVLMKIEAESCERLRISPKGRILNQNIIRVIEQRFKNEDYVLKLYLDLWGQTKFQ